MLWSSVAVAVLLGALAVVIALVSATRLAADVTEQVAPEVIRQVVQDSRAQRVANARAVLGAANQVLASRGLPMVADPGPTATAEQVLAAASSAQVLSVLPEGIVQQLRDQLDGRPIVLPSAAADPDDLGAATTSPPGSAAPDRPAAPGPTGGVPAVPGAPGGAGGAGGGAERGTPGGTAGPGGNTTAPPPTRRRLIPQIVPLPIPLIGT